MSGERRKTYNCHSPLSKCSPGGNSANFSKCSGRKGSEIVCSSPNHFPKSTSLQRCEQNGPYFPANQSPTRLHVGHLTFIAAQNNTGCLRRPIWIWSKFASRPPHPPSLKLRRGERQRLQQLISPKV